ncbi:MFS transporter [Staphylococcus schleiferi]|uniref:MFS transporter n=1 Tax=Staphylococcus schleiferi TaxID=1295 RepID=UPI00247FCC12|nr:MFS transporter [Staphylococcus schleiferi]
MEVKKITSADDNKMTAIKVDAKPIGIKDKIGYMLGDIGNDAILGLVNSFLMIYYTNVLGIAGGIVGILFMISRIIDAFADISVGRMIDIAELTPEGRFKPWIRRMKYPFCLISLLLFLPLVNDWNDVSKIIYVFATYLIFGVVLSAINIPYGSMAAAISDHPDDRAALSTFRSVGAAIGMSTTGFLIPIFIYKTNEHGEKTISGMRFFIIALICCSIAFVVYIIINKMLVERVQIKKKEKVTIGRLLKGLFTDRAILILIIVDFFVVLTQILYGTTTTYLFNDYFHNPKAMSVAMLFNWGTVILVAAPTIYFVRRFGKKEVTMVALPFSSLMFFILFFLHTTNPWVYVSLMFFATIGYSVFNVIVWALITDVIDAHQYHTGLREDGTVYGLNSFARKVAQAFSGGIGGLMLAVIGYQSSTSGGVMQSAIVQERIYMLSNLLPAVLFLVAALILIFGYPMNKKTTDRIARELREERERTEVNI